EVELAGIGGTGDRRHGDTAPFRGGLTCRRDGEEEASAGDGVVALVGVAIVRIEQARGRVDGGKALVLVTAGWQRGEKLPAIGGRGGFEGRARGPRLLQEARP